MPFYTGKKRTVQCPVCEDMTRPIDMRETSGGDMCKWCEQSVFPTGQPGTPITDSGYHRIRNDQLRRMRHEK